jgi:hypothetical protein
MQWLSQCRKRSFRTSLSAGYPCDEWKQIPLFRNTGNPLRFPSAGTGSGSSQFQLNGGIE